MSVSKIAGILLGSAAMVAGHGYVTGAVVDGQYYNGYRADSYGYMADPPKVIGWTTSVRDNGFVDGSSYSSPDIICHRDATPGGISAPIKAGGKVELQWTEWPESHKGPVINYLAKCDGDCSSADKASLKWFKIEAEGLLEGNKWASDALIANNNSASVTIPTSIAPGNYVLRHEIIALHSANNKDGAQNYPQCFNLKVTGGGSDSPAGVAGTSLYKDTDPGILVNIYSNLKSYVIPGPAVYSAGSSSSSSGSDSAAPATTATPSATSVSSSPSSSSIVGPSQTPVQPKSTRLPRPSPSGRPKKHCKPKNKKKIATTTASVVPSAATATTTTIVGQATATIPAQVTDSIPAQTPSADDSVTVTASAGGQSAASATSVPSSNSGSSSSGSSSSGSSSSGSAPSSSGSSSYNSNDWSSYLSSLSAEQALSVVRDTLKWLVSDQKVHARDLRV